MVRPSRRAFFYPRPVCRTPLGNRLLVSFTGTTLWLLGTPAQATQEMPDARRLIGLAEVPGNDGRNTREGPQFIPEAIGTGALAE
jgi:hypothetical protein